MITEPASNHASQRLGLHVINGGYGESIVLELPDDQWGVVDCYSPQLSQPDRNPTLQFLRERSVRKLEFLALTHPHSDHYHGLKDLLDHFEVKAFWWFAGLSPADLPRLVNGLRIDAFEKRDRRNQHSARYLDRTFRTVIAQRTQGTLVTTQMSDFKELYPHPLGGRQVADALTIHTLAPFTDSVQPHPHTLPHSDAITEIRDSTSQIISTCTPAMTFSTSPSYDYWSEYDAGVQLSLRAVFPTFMAERPFDIGVCSFWFDAQGQVVDANLRPPASVI